MRGLKFLKRSYRRHISLNDYLCFYCNAYAGTKDHIPSRRLADLFPDNERIVVRSCLLCNCILGARNMHTLKSRIEYLLIKYRIRFRKYIEMPIWEDWEIEQLQGKLKRKIIFDLKKKKYCQERLEFLEANLDIYENQSPEDVFKNIIPGDEDED